GLMPSASGQPQMASDGSNGTDRSNSVPASAGALDGTDRSNSPMAARLDGTDRSNSPARALSLEHTGLDGASLSDEDDDAGDRDEEDEEPVLRGRRRWPRDRAKPPVLKIGVLPVARRDSERLRQILAIQHRLRGLESSPRAKRTLIERGPF